MLNFARAGENMRCATQVATHRLAEILPHEANPEVGLATEMEFIAMAMTYSYPPTRLSIVSETVPG